MDAKKSEQAKLEKKRFQFVLMGLIVSLSLSLVAFEWQTMHALQVEDDFAWMNEVIEEEMPIVILKNQKKLELPKPKAKPTPHKTDPVVATTPIPSKKDLPDTGISLDSIDLSKYQFSEPPVSDEPILIPEVNPEFPGGEVALFRFLGKVLRYPERAKDANIHGMVYVEFIVERNGEVSQVKVLKGIGGGCDEEAVRAVGEMPRWKPGFQGGQEVRVLYRLPINFVLKR